jgi:hypothetical protein
VVDAAFTVTLSRPASAAVSVGVATANGTAKAPKDFAATSGVVTFAPGQTSRTLAVHVNGDRLYELAERFTVDLTAPSGATILDGKGTGTILDDDPQPTITIDDVRLTEGSAGPRTMTFLVRLSAPSGVKTSLRYATADGSATVGDADYTAASGKLSVAAGKTTAAVVIVVNGDTAPEPDEAFAVNLSAPVNATLADAQAIGTIVNDD